MYCTSDKWGRQLRETNKKGTDELKKRVERKLVQGRERVDRRQAAVANKDQILHPLRILHSRDFNRSTNLSMEINS